jgi:hypothetical protein
MQNKSRRKKTMKKILSLVLSLILLVSMAAIPAVAEDYREPITLTMFSQLANYAGEQGGWFAKELKDRFNVTLKYVSTNVDGNAWTAGVAAGDLGDIICLGDIQKSAYNILNVMLHTQDFGILCDDLGIERAPEYENFSAHFDAPLAGEYKDVNVDKAAPAAADVLHVSDDEVALGTIAAGVEVTYNGDVELSSLRVQIETELPIFEGYDNIQNIEFNPDNNKLVVYEVNGEALGENLFFINFVVDECAPGTYPVKVNVIEATGADAELVDLVGGIGYVTIKGSEVPGDVNQDGIVDNRDLIMIARYLVDLEDFDFDQKKLADYDEDGEIDNTDLVLIARALVEKAEA